ncbi:MAG: hypothetical protein R2860_05120, partial [Desulfobacterales bacterium]
IPFLDSIVKTGFRAGDMVFNGGGSDGGEEENTKNKQTEKKKKTVGKFFDYHSLPLCLMWIRQKEPVRHGLSAGWEKITGQPIPLHLLR